MKKTKIIISIFIMMLLVILLPLTISAAQINPERYEPGELTQSDVGQLVDVTADILATIRNLGIISSVLILAIIGIKYIMGSLQEKADYKKDLFAYVCGCFLLAMATTIPSIVYKIMN